MIALKILGNIDGCKPTVLLALLAESLTKFVLENLQPRWPSIRMGVEIMLMDLVSLVTWVLYVVIRIHVWSRLIIRTWVWIQPWIPNGHIGGYARTLVFSPLLSSSIFLVLMITIWIVWLWVNGHITDRVRIHVHNTRLLVLHGLLENMHSDKAIPLKARAGFSKPWIMILLSYEYFGGLFNIYFSVCLKAQRETFDIRYFIILGIPLIHKWYF